MKRLILVFVLFGTIFAAGTAQHASAAPAGAWYALPAVSYTPACTDIDCDIFTSTYDFAGDGDCIGCLPPNPVRGAFSLSFTPDRFYPIDPIKARSGTGTLNVVWADSTTTIATYEFKARDSKVYAISGRVTGGTNAHFAAGTWLSGLVGLPPNPVEPGTTFAAIAFG